MTDIKAVILAAGKGTRMKSETTPKVLHQILGKTLLGYVLDNVKNFVSEEFVIVGHHAEEVEEFVKTNYTNAKTVLQSPQLGTGHAVSMVCPELENFDGLVIILCGDTPLVKEDTLKKFVEFHQSNNSDITVMSTIFENPTNYGRIIREADNSLECIVEEKDATREQKAVKEVNAGIYCLNWGKIKSAFSQLKSNNAQGEYYLTDIIAWGKAQHLNVNAYILDNSDEIYGINSRLNLAQAAKMMNKRNLEKYMENGVTIVDPDSTWISEDTEIGQDTANYNPLTKEKSKTILKDNVKIGSNSVLVAPVTVEEGTNVGAGTIVTKNLPAWALAITRSPLKILENWVKKQLNK